MSMLLPSLSKAREAARRGVCKSNHHQFYLSVQMYSDDSNGYFPDERMTGPAQKIPSRDKANLDPYIPDWKVTDCPNFPLENNTYGQGVSSNQQTGILLLAGLTNAANIGSQTDWESPLTIASDSGLLVLADYNEVPGGSWNTRFTHTRTGGFKTDSAIQPAAAGVEGTVVTKLNGSTIWRSIRKMKSYAANPGYSGVQYWW